MLIRESTLRKIIKEEARRVLKEDATSGWTPAEIDAKEKEFAAAGQGTALTKYTAAWQAVNLVITKLNSTLGKFPEYKYIFAGWGDIYKFGASGARSNSVLQTLNGLRADMAPHDKVRGVLRSISSNTVFTGAPSGQLGIADFDMAQGASPAATETQDAIKSNVLDPATFLENVKFVVSFDLGKEMSGASPANPMEKAKAITGRTHTIAKGDTLSALAQRYYGIPLGRSNMPLYDQLAKANGMTDANQTIKPGQVLKLPVSLGTFNLKV